MKTSGHAQRLALFLLLVVAAPPSAGAYGLLTHQQLIDQSWKSAIVPILLSRFPSLTAQQLSTAHAYAYGGSVIQDLGYYPFSNGFFSDLTHYVRTGDFVRSLFRNARTADELAFAIGALAHYFGDSIGHSQVTNRSVAIEFPKLSAKYGPSVNYAQDKIAHSRVEFAFDINQAVTLRLAPYDVVVSIGLKVPWGQLAAAFQETYGFPLRDILGPSSNAMRAYHFGARRFLPAVTYAEGLIHHHRFPLDPAGTQFNLYEQRTAQLAREAEWDRYRKKPGPGTHLMAGLIFILPKIGPLKVLAIKGPTVQTQSLYIESVNLTTTALALALTQLGAPDPSAEVTDRMMTDLIRKSNAEMAAGVALPPASVPLPTAPPAATISASLVPNRDLDTGKRVVPGEYSLTDQTYARLLAGVTKNPWLPVPDGLKQDVLQYYADPDAPISTRRDKKKWARVQQQLLVLSTMPTEPDLVLP
ncbi:MAG: zinc dependent phospholipase C family protein [Candidatus Solibacter sp.]